MILFHFIWILIFFDLFLFCGCDSYIDDQQADCYSMRFSDSDPNFSYKGNLTFLGLNCQSEIQENQYEGKVIAYRYHPDCVLGLGDQVAKSGAHAIVITIQTVVPNEIYAYMQVSNTYSQIPFYCCTETPQIKRNMINWINLKEISVDINAAVNDWENGGWAIMILHQIIIIPWCLINAFYSFKGIKDYFTFSQGEVKPFWLPITCLTFELIGSLLKTMSQIDPLLVYGFVPIFWNEITLAAFSPFVASTAVLITLYWNELILKVRKNKELVTGLSYFKIPFVILSVIFFGLAVLFTFSIFYIDGGSDALLRYWLGGAFIFEIFLSLFIVLTGYRLNKTFNSKWEGETSLKKVSTLIVSSTYLFPIKLLAYSIVVLGNNWAAFSVGYILGYIGSIAQDSLKILAFQKEERIYSSSSSGVTSQSISLSETNEL